MFLNGFLIKTRVLFQVKMRLWIDNIQFPPCSDSVNSIAGDTNYDGQINVLDIVLVVNMILV